MADCLNLQSPPPLYVKTGEAYRRAYQLYPDFRVDKILNGEYNKEMGDPRGIGSWKTLEVYLVNRDKRMITYSLFTKDTAPKQAINTLPVEMSLISDKEMSGFYKDYRGQTLPAYLCAYHR